jgi:hypothetical protein
MILSPPRFNTFVDVLTRDTLILIKIFPQIISIIIEISSQKFYIYEFAVINLKFLKIADFIK